MKNKIIFGSPLSGVKICTLWKNIPYQGIHISGCKLSIYFAQKNYFFYFTHSFLQNTHISLFILHIYSIKYSLFYHLLLFSHLLPLSLSLRPNHHHHHYPSWRIDPTIIIIITRSLHTQPPSSPTPIGEQTHSRPIEVVETQKPRCLIASGPWRRGFRRSQQCR